jgi:hypothetical protein
LLTRQACGDWGAGDVVAVGIDDAAGRRVAVQGGEAPAVLAAAGAQRVQRGGDVAVDVLEREPDYAAAALAQARAKRESLVAQT